MVPKTHIGAVGAFLKLLGKKKENIGGIFWPIIVKIVLQGPPTQIDTFQTNIFS